MELSGKVIQKLQEVSGNSKSGNNWRKQEFIIETPGNYPKKVCVALWGDKIDQFPISVGEEIKLSVDVESREYNGRWYTDIKAYKVEKASETTNSTPTFNNGPLDVDTFHSDEEDQLPF